jgi:hypothetical protein
MDNVHTRGAGPDSNDKALARKSRNPNDDADDAAESQITAGARIDYNGVSLIPCLLSEERPKDMDTLWPRRRYLSPPLSFFSPPLSSGRPTRSPSDGCRRGDGISEFGRVYRFNFVPAGFFGRVMVRLLNFKLEKAKKYWRNGYVPPQLLSAHSCVVSCVVFAHTRIRLHEGCFCTTTRRRCWSSFCRRPISSISPSAR